MALSQKKKLFIISPLAFFISGGGFLGPLLVGGKMTFTDCTYSWSTTSLQYPTRSEKKVSKKLSKHKRS